MKTINTLAAVLLLGSVIGESAALAQATGEPNNGTGVLVVPGNKSGPAATPPNSGPALQSPMGLQDRAQGNEEEDEDQDAFFNQHPGMMGMIQRGHGHGGWFQGRRVMNPMMMHIIFSLMDADGDGKLTLQEWQAAHERIFKAMDTDHDGTVTLEEMQNFMRGTTSPAASQH